MTPRQSYGIFHEPPRWVVEYAPGGRYAKTPLWESHIRQKEPPTREQIAQELRGLRWMSRQ